MRLVQTFEGTVAADADAVFAQLASETKADGVTVVRDAATERALWVEGAWWFHGRWSVTPSEGGANVRLEVWSKATGPQRLLAAVPVRQALRRVRRDWDDDLASLAGRRPGN